MTKLEMQDSPPDYLNMSNNQLYQELIKLGQEIEKLGKNTSSPASIALIQEYSSNVQTIFGILEKRASDSQRSLSERVDILLLLEELRDILVLERVRYSANNIDYGYIEKSRNDTFDILLYGGELSSGESVPGLICEAQGKEGKLKKILEDRARIIDESKERMHKVFKEVTDDVGVLNKMIRDDQHLGTLGEPYTGILTDLCDTIDAGGSIAEGVGVLYTTEGIGTVFAGLLSSEDDTQARLLDPYRSIIVEELIIQAQGLALEKIETYYTQPGQYTIKRSPAEIRKMQVSLVALHEVAGYGAPAIDGIMIEMDNAHYDFMQLETTWFVYALELSKLIPNVMGILLQLPLEEEAVSRGKQKRTVLDFCRLYHPIRNWGARFETQVPRELLQNYFMGLATMHADADAMVMIDIPADDGSGIVSMPWSIQGWNGYHHKRIAEYLQGFYALRLDQLTKLQQKQQTLLLEKTDAYAQRYDAIPDDRKKLQERQKTFTEDIGKNNSFWNRIFQMKGDGMLYTDYRQGKGQCDALYQGIQGYTELSAEIRDATFAVYETAFQMASLIHDRDQQAMILLSIVLECGASYVQQHKAMYQVAKQIHSDKNPFGKTSQEYKIFDVLLFHPEQIASLFTSTGSLNNYLLDRNAFFKDKLTIEGYIPLNGQGYDKNFFDCVFPQGYNIQESTLPIATISIGGQQVVCDFSKIQKELKSCTGGVKRPTGGIPVDISTITCFADIGQYAGIAGARYLFDRENLDPHLVKESGRGNGQGYVRRGDESLPLIRPSLEDLQIYTHDVSTGTYKIHTISFETDDKKAPVLAVSAGTEVTTENEIGMVDAMADRRRQLLASHPTIALCQQIATETEAVFAPFFALMQQGGMSTPAIVNDILGKRTAMKARMKNTGQLLADDAFRTQIKALEGVVKTREPGRYRDQVEAQIAFLLSDVQSVKSFFGPGGRAGSILEELDEITSFSTNGLQGRWAKEGWKLVVIVLVTVATMSLTGGLGLGAVGSVLFSSAMGGMAGAVTQEVLQHLEEDIYTRSTGRRSYGGVARQKGMTFVNNTPAELYAQGKIDRNTMVSSYGASVAQQMGMSLGLHFFGRFVGQPLGRVLQLGKSMEQLKLGMSKLSAVSNKFLAQYLQRGTQSSFTNLGKLVNRGKKGVVRLGNSEVVEEITEETLYEKIAEELLGPAGQRIVGMFGSFNQGDVHVASGSRVDPTTNPNNPLSAVDMTRGTDMVPEVLVRGRMEDLQAQMEHMKAQFADLNPTIVYSEDDTGATVSFADQSSVRFRLIDETSSIPRQIQSCLLQMGIKAEDVGNVISLNEEGKNFTITLPNTAPDSGLDVQGSLLALLRTHYTVVAKGETYTLCGVQAGEVYTVQFAEASPSLPLTYGPLRSPVNDTIIIPIQPPQSEEILNRIKKNTTNFPGFSLVSAGIYLYADETIPKNCHHFAVTIQQDNAFVLGDSFAAMALVAQHVDESSSSQISPGELIYFCRDKIAFDRPFAEEDSAHSAIFVGDGLYLSQFGPDGPIALTTARQIEELYGTRYRYRIPRRREDTEGLSLDLVSANFQHHIDQLISLFPAGTFVDVSGSDLSPDTISTRTLVDMFHALATNRDDARGVHDPYDAVVAYIQQMDTPSRLLLAELLVGKAVGQEIIDAHRSSGSLHAKRGILEKAHPGYYTSTDIRVLFRRGVCGMYQLGSKRSRQNYERNLDLMRDRCVPSINSRTTVSDVGALYEDVPYEQLANFLYAYSDLSITKSFLSNMSIRNLIRGYHNFLGLKEKGIKTLDDVLKLAVSLEGLEYRAEAVENMITGAQGDLYQDFLKHSFLAGGDTNHCGWAAKSMQSAIRDKGGIVMKGPTCAVYTKHNKLEASSLYYSHGRWHTYGDVADMYFYLGQYVYDATKSVEEKGNINTAEILSSLIEDIPTVASLVKEITIVDGYLVVELNEDPSFLGRPLEVLVEESVDLEMEERGRKDHQTMLDVANESLPRFPLTPSDIQLNEIDPSMNSVEQQYFLDNNQYELYILSYTYPQICAYIDLFVELKKQGATDFTYSGNTGQFLEIAVIHKDGSKQLLQFPLEIDDGSYLLWDAQRTYGYVYNKLSLMHEREYFTSITMPASVPTMKAYQRLEETASTSGGISLDKTALLADSRATKLLHNIYAELSHLADQNNPLAKQMKMLCDTRLVFDDNGLVLDDLVVRLLSYHDLVSLLYMLDDTFVPPRIHALTPLLRMAVQQIVQDQKLSSINIQQTAAMLQKTRKDFVFFMEAQGVTGLELHQGNLTVYYDQDTASFKLSLTDCSLASTADPILLDPVSSWTIDDLLRNDGDLLHTIRQQTPATMHVVEVAPEIVSLIRNCSDADRDRLIDLLVPGLDQEVKKEIFKIHEIDVAQRLRTGETLASINSDKFRRLSTLGISAEQARMLMEFGVCGKEIEVHQPFHEQNPLYENIFGDKRVRAYDAVEFQAGVQEVRQTIKQQGYTVVLLPERGAGPIRTSLQALADAEGITNIHFVKVDAGTQHVVGGTEVEKVRAQETKRIYVKAMQEVKDTYGTDQKVLVVDSAMTGLNLSQNGNAISNACTDLGFDPPGYFVCTDTYFSDKTPHYVSKKFYQDAMRDGRFFQIHAPMYFENKSTYLNAYFSTTTGGNRPSVGSLGIINHQADAYFQQMMTLVQHPETAHAVETQWEQFVIGYADGVLPAEVTPVGGILSSETYTWLRELFVDMTQRKQVRSVQELRAVGSWFKVYAEHATAMAEFRETLTEVKQKIGNPEMTDTELRQHMRQIASTKQTLHPPYDAVVHQIRSLADDAHGYQQRKIRAQFLTGRAARKEIVSAHHAGTIGEKVAYLTAYSSDQRGYLLRRGVCGTNEISTTSNRDKVFNLLMTQYKIPENNKTQVTTLPVLMLADHVKVERIQAFLTAFPEVTQANLCSALCIALMRSRSITDFDARKTSLREFGEKFSELLADDAFPRESNLYAILHDTDFLLEHPEIAKVFEYTYRVGNGYTYCRNAPPTMSTSILEKGGVKIVGATTTSYTKTDTNIPTSLFRTDDAWKTYGLLADRYQVIIADIRRMTSVDGKQRNLSTLDPQEILTLSAYLKGTYPLLIKDVIIDQAGFFSVILAGDQDLEYQEISQTHLESPEWQGSFTPRRNGEYADLMQLADQHLEPSASTVLKQEVIAILDEQCLEHELLDDRENNKASYYRLAGIDLDNRYLCEQIDSIIVGRDRMLSCPTLSVHGKNNAFFYQIALPGTTLSSDPNDPKNHKIHINSISVRGVQYTGLSFVEQTVKTAKELGYGGVTVSASGTGTDNGYYTFARYGFAVSDGDSEAKVLACFEKASRRRDMDADELAEVGGLLKEGGNMWHHLMSTPIGRYFWYTYGKDAIYSAEIDLTQDEAGSDSASYRAFQAYLRERGTWVLPATLTTENYPGKTLYLYRELRKHPSVIWEYLGQHEDLSTRADSIGGLVRDIMKIADAPSRYLLASVLLPALRISPPTGANMLAERAEVLQQAYNAPTAESAFLILEQNGLSAEDAGYLINRGIFGKKDVS